MSQETGESRSGPLGNMVGIGVYDFDGADLRVHWSPELRALAGLPQDGTPVELPQLEALIHPEDRQRVISNLHRLLNSHRPMEFDHEWRLRRPDGAVRWVNDKGRLFFVGPQEAPARVMTGIIIDVTSSHPDEVASINPRAELIALVDSALDAIMGAGLDHRIVLFNPMAARMFRCAPWEALGARLEQFVPWDILATLRTPVQEATETGEVTAPINPSVICTGRRADGEEFPIEISIAEVQSQGEVRVLLTIQDLSERYQSEVALKRLNDRLEAQRRQIQEGLQGNEALKRSNQELQHFALVAAHDLQAPLRSIKRFASRLQHECDGRLGEEADTWMDYLQRSTQRMQSLVQDLLIYTRIDVTEYAFAPTDLREVVEDVIIALDADVQDKGARITRDRNLPIVTGDAAQLSQLFQNLIANGIKYHNDRRPRVHISARWSSGEWVVSVSDNGIGIPPQEQQAIFNLFRRLHAHDEYPGAGIGLAVCKKVVERHGGRIWVESTPGQGSIFSFTLPGLAR